MCIRDRCEMKEIFTFIYMAEVGCGLTEHEFDHVLIGTCDDTPQINHEEVESYKYLSINDIKQKLSEHPELFTEWFKIAFAELLVELGGKE